MFLLPQVMACQNRGWKHIFEKCVFLRFREDSFFSTFFPLLPFLSLTTLSERCIWSFVLSLLFIFLQCCLEAATKSSCLLTQVLSKCNWRTIRCPEVLTICIDWEHVKRLTQIHTADQQASWDQLHVSKSDLASLCPKLHPFCCLNPLLWFLSTVQPPMDAHCAHPPCEHTQLCLLQWKFFLWYLYITLLSYRNTYMSNIREEKPMTPMVAVSNIHILVLINLQSCHDVLFIILASVLHIAV